MVKRGKDAWKVIAVEHEKDGRAVVTLGDVEIEDSVSDRLAMGS